MIITILTTGSRGDTQPYLALGLALKNAGHSVRIAAFENYKEFVESFGFEFHPIRGDVSKAALSENARGARTADNPLKLLLSFNKLQSLVFDLQQDFFNACLGADAVVYHPGAAIGYYAAQHLRIPSILATPFPMTPTREYPALIFYDSIRLGKSYNYITHKIFEQIMWLASRSPIKQFWKQEFGSLPPDFGSPFSRQNAPCSPTIISCSDHVFPRPPDWPEYVYNTGYWFLDDEAGWQPPTELLDFLERGLPPVYVGFGSIGDPALAGQTTELVIAALKRSGKRGVLATGWNGLSKIDCLPEDMFILESAPHAWLFPRMAAVVHHGGAGTTAAGLRAGIPSVIIPASNDQFAWGRRVYELGAGSKPIPRKKLSTEILSEAINFTLKSEIVAASEALGNKIQTETGAQNAAKIIISCNEHRT
jgi:sterol 3beta-glucosyltransferase